MQLKESESKLETMLIEKKPENEEVPPLEDTTEAILVQVETSTETEDKIDNTSMHDKSCTIKNNNDSTINNNLKKVTNIENEQLNKTLQNVKASDDTLAQQEIPNIIESVVECKTQITELDGGISEENCNDSGNNIEIVEIESTPCKETEIRKDDEHLNAILRKNILSCVEKVALIEEMKKCKSPTRQQDQVSGC